MSDADIAAELTNVPGTGALVGRAVREVPSGCLDVWPTGNFSVRLDYAPPGVSRYPHPKHSTRSATHSGPTAASSPTPPGKSRPTRICSLAAR
jgi:hypothetical protein